MSTNKRRQVIKEEVKQTQIPFPQQKNKGSGADTFSGVHHSHEKIEAPKPYAQYSGAKEIQSPYRSMNRIKSLLSRSPFQPQPGTSKFLDAESFLRKVGLVNSMDYSKPSSATTACTYAPNEFSSASKSDISKSAQKRKRDTKKDIKKNSNSKPVVGSKRQGQIKLEDMEYFLRLHSKNAKLIARMFKLRDKKTGQTFEFPIFDENQMPTFKGNPIITNFDMSKLEVEYDYDTDCEQLKHSKKMMFHELIQAIEFFIKEDPIKLVDNVLL